MGASPDWVKLAEAFGAKGMQSRRGELVDDIKAAWTRTARSSWTCA